MELSGIGPGGKLRDEIELSQQLAHHLTGVIALAQLFDLTHDARQRVFRLGNGRVRVVLALALETRMMLAQLLSEVISEALAGNIPERLRASGGNAVRQTSLEMHLGWKTYPV